jgi:tetratricopeptide (TPR) repeat protein
MSDLLLCLALQLVIYGFLGEMVVRWLAGFSPWKQHLPEAAFLAGLPAYALTGYLALPFARTAQSIPIAAGLAGCCLWLALRRPPLRGSLPGLFQAYLAWRNTRWFQAGLALGLLLVLLIGFERIPWLIGLQTSQGVMSGTVIWDDLRTLGGPIALAAHGFPLRSPIAVEMQWPYPAASFIYPAGMIAWAPGSALAILVADTMVQTLFYGLAVVVLAPSAAGAGVGSILFCATAFLSGSFNLWNLPLQPEWEWVEYFFGYHRIGGLLTTIGWTPYGGLLWISNHTLGLSAILLAVKWPALCILFALFAAGSSMDMTAMASVALACVLLVRLWRWRFGGQPLPGWFWRAAWAGLLAFTLVALINLPTLTRQVDSPYDPIFPLNTTPRYNLGLLACGVGPYLLVLGSAFLMARSRRFLAGSEAWLIAISVGLAFSLLFQFHSIWFWRFAFAAHVLFGLVCAAAYRNLEGLPAARRLAVVWCLLLIPGAVELAFEVSTSWRYARRHTRDVADALLWIRQRLPIHARVAEALDDKGVIAPSVDLLRTGNRGGVSVYDRSHALLGFTEYRRKFSDVAAAIANNDYLLVRTSSPYGRLMQVCGAARRFHNPETAIYEITDACRASLPRRELRSMILETFRPLWNPYADPALLPTEVLLFAVQAKPEYVGILRKRMETLWGRGEWERAEYLGAKMLELRPDISEVHYSYAFTQQALGNPESAIRHYSEALRLGYLEFWVRYNRGSAYLSSKEYEKAWEDLSRARKLDPAHAGIPPLLEKASQALRTLPAAARR